MPNPNKGESQDDFISRCMGDAEANRSFPKEDQRAAFCYSQWRNHGRKDHSMADDAGLAATKDLIGSIAEAALAVLRKPVTAADVPEDAPQVGSLEGVEIFTIGEWHGSKTVKADSAMLDRIVQNFNDLNSKVSGFGVPAKLGHMTLPGDPAYGWMSSLVRVGDTLLANFSDVPLAIVDAIGKRRYNAVSIELYPQIKYGGKTFKDVLGGVAFLGAEAPAVKGLKPLSAAKFSEAGGEVVTLTSKEADMPNETLKFSQEQADALVTAAVSKATADLTAANTKLTADLSAATTRADTAEAAMKSFQKDQAKAAFTAVIDEAIKDGRALDKDRPVLEAVAATFQAAPKTKVGEVEMSGLDLFKAHVATMQPKVKFGEQGQGNRNERPGNGGKKASDELAELAAVKRAAVGPDKMSYEQAVDAVLGENAELKARYAQGE